MAKISTEFMPERQALLITEHADFKLGPDAQELTDAVKKAFGQYPALRFIVVDSRASTFSFDDMLVGVNHIAKELAKVPVKAVVIVAPNAMKQASAKGMKHDLFGNIPSAAFGTIEEAFDYIAKIRD